MREFVTVGRDGRVGFGRDGKDGIVRSEVGPVQVALSDEVGGSAVKGRGWGNKPVSTRAANMSSDEGGLLT